MGILTFISNRKSQQRNTRKAIENEIETQKIMGRAVKDRNEYYAYKEKLKHDVAVLSERQHPVRTGFIKGVTKVSAKVDKQVIGKARLSKGSVNPMNTDNSVYSRNDNQVNARWIPPPETPFGMHKNVKGAKSPFQDDKEKKDIWM